MEIKKIRDCDVFVALKSICIYLKTELWVTLIAAPDVLELQFKLAIAKSKQFEKDIDQLSEIDTDLRWGEKKYSKNGGKRWVIRHEGDFNPWYNGDLKLEDLLYSLSDTADFLSGMDDMKSAEFLHFYEFLDKWGKGDGVLEVDKISAGFPLELFYSGNTLSLHGPVIPNSITLTHNQSTGSGTLLIRIFKLCKKDPTKWIGLSKKALDPMGELDHPLELGLSSVRLSKYFTSIGLKKPLRSLFVGKAKTDLGFNFRIAIPQNEWKEIANKEKLVKYFESFG
jgi:hypothetical protein